MVEDKSFWHPFGPHLQVIYIVQADRAWMPTVLLIRWKIDVMVHCACSYIYLLAYITTRMKVELKMIIELHVKVDIIFFTYLHYDKI